MTAKSIAYVESLDPKYRTHLENIKTFSKNLEAADREKAKHHINGYLTALNDAGIIGDVQRRALLTYYTLNL